MSENINAGVVCITRFSGASSGAFSTYVDYIDRNEAVRNEMFSEYSLYNDYMDNPEKTTGLFTKNKMQLTKDEKKELKNVFRIAQENDSLMWQTVISFDNRWLEQYGLYDSERKFLDERKIKEITTGAINKMLQNEGLENAVWSASIHYNTDNIHVHIATVEPHPSRQMKEYQVYREQIVNGKKVKIPVMDDNNKPLKKKEYVGRFKGRSIELCKKHVVDEIVAQKEQNLEINKIIREDILKQKAEHVLSTDKDLGERFMNIYQCLPRTGNKGLWNYNNKAMTQIRPMIDDLIRAYIEKYNKDDYKLLVEMLTRQSEMYKTAYGVNGSRDFKESKIDELYSRLGNQILKEMKEYDRQTGGEEYRPEDAERIMEEFLENQREEKETEEVHEIDDDIFINIDDLDSFEMEWTDNYKIARRLLYGRVKDYEKAYAMLKKEIENNNVLAIYEMGNIYEKGIGTEIDNEKAAYYYKKALSGFEQLYEEKDSYYLEYRIGKMHYYGQGTEKDLDMAFDYLEGAANGNNIYASYIVGNMYWNGEFVDVDKRTAFEYYKAARGKKNSKTNNYKNPYACFKVGQIYEKGEIVPENKEEAYSNYKSAYYKFETMEKESPDANLEYKLGIMNLKGLGKEVDMEKAEKYFEQSGKNGNTFAQYQYAKILLGKGDEENANKAIKLLKKAASKNNKTAQYALGDLYISDERFFNESQAIYYFSMVADENQFAQYQLAKIYGNENSKFYDLDKSIDYLEKCAGNKNEYAAYKLGKIYSNQNEKYYDIEKAVHYFEIAAESNNIYAKYQLSKIYLDKESAYYNISKGERYLIDVADSGNQYAQYKAGKLYTDKESKLFNPEKGIKYFQMASEQGNEYANIALGFIYFKGEIVDKDVKLARNYFQMASEQGNELATKMVEIIDNPAYTSKYSKYGKGRLGSKKFKAYSMERALNSLKRAFEDTLEKERAIRMHERYLEQERMEKEKEERIREEEQYAIEENER